ncbi:MAG: 7-carboxy-7-deazaguanine synthase QueE [Planctomycetes bacterium]|nr:7-carboxy-7-deazaguanine synthase QueE [Planctomycetota bacterium]
MNGSGTATRTGVLSEVFCTFQGEGPHVGKRHLFVRLGGCSVGCRFCDTPDALRPGQGYAVRIPGLEVVRPNPIEPEAAVALVRDAVSRVCALHAVSVTGGEPLEQVDFLEPFLAGLAPLPVLLETAGTLPDALARVIDSVAIVSMDFKLPSVAHTAPSLDAHRRFLRLARRREVYVKVVVNDRLDAAEWDDAVRLLLDEAPDVPFIVQPETRRNGSLATTFSALAALADRATRLGLTDVRVIPQVHKFLGAP